MIRFLICCVLCASVYGNEEDLFCKDPDTEEYHPVNATWRSTSFCGNYTCKVRPKNNTATEYIPTNNDKVSREAKTNKLIDKIKQAIVEEQEPSNSNKENNICVDCNEINTGDRYLNNEEVNSIAKFLYSVKKSDLDTLVQVYNLVNDMYGEMDTAATENTPEVTSVIRSPQNLHTANLESYYPYWYNPSNYPYWQNYFSRPLYSYTYPNVYTQNAVINPTDTKKALKQNNIEKALQLLSHATSEKKEEMRTDASESHPYSFYPGATYPQHYGQAYGQYAQNPFLSNNGVATQNSQTAETPGVIFVMPSTYLQGTQNYSSPYGQYPATPVQYANYQNQGQLTPKINEVKLENQPAANAHYTSSNVYAPQTLTTPELTRNPAITNSNNCPWKTPPLSPNVLENVRAHVVRKTPSAVFKPKLLQPGLLGPMKKIRLERVGKVLRLNELKRKSRDVEDQFVEKEEISAEDQKRNTDFEEKVIKEDGDVSQESVTEANEEKIDENFDDIEEQNKEIEEEINPVEEEQKDLKAKSNAQIKKQENDTMETYIVETSCNLETEPGYFRAGDISLPFPLCCPQRIED